MLTAKAIRSAGIKFILFLLVSFFIVPTAFAVDESCNELGEEWDDCQKEGCDIDTFLLILDDMIVAC